MIVRVVLPYHLCNLVRIPYGTELEIDACEPVCQRSILDALEAAYPVLRGTIRDHGTLRRRPFLRFFACGMDISLDPADTPLPDDVACGREPFVVIGAIAGG
jgi:hypothetical protein